MLGAIDVPAPGLVVSPKLLQVLGWTLPVDAPVVRIHVRVDGRDIGLARQFSQPRPDIAHRSPEPSAPLAGFECWARIAGTPGERMLIEVDVEDLTGVRRSLEPSEITVGPAHHAIDRAHADHASVRVPTSQVASRVQHSTQVRIAVFTHRLDRGGAQLYLQELLEELLTDPDISCLVVSAADGPLRAQLEDLGVEVLVADFPVGTIGAYEASISGFTAAIQRHGTNVVLVNTLLAGLGADVAVRLHIPMIWMIHETVALDEFWLAAYGDGGMAADARSAITGALAQANMVVFETRASRSMLEDDCAAGHSVVVPHGVRLEPIDEFRATVAHDAARRTVGVADDNFLVLNVGAIEPHKGQAALVFAFAHIAHDYPRASLVLVGDAGIPYALALRDSIDRIGLGRRIRIERAVTDPNPWYRAADAFVLPSDMETMPRTLLEAMAFELPVAATSIAGIPDLVAHGRNGLLFPSRDLGALIEALREILDLPAEERIALGVAGSRDVRASYDSSTIVDAIRTMISALTDQAGSSSR